MTDTDIKDNNTRANKSLTDEDKEALKHFVMWESTIMPELPKKPTKYSFIKEKLMDNSNIFL